MAKASVVRNRPRLVDSVAETLRDWIITGRLPGGTQLLQTELAEQLEISRTPLREAFRILERDGLVRTSNNNRTVEVVTITLNDVRDMFRLRVATDGLAASSAAERGLNASERTRAGNLLVELTRTANEPFDAASRVRAHADFHECISIASGNRAMDALLPLIRISCAAMYLPIDGDSQAVPPCNDVSTPALGEVLQVADAQHRAILEAISTGKAEEAAELAEDHCRRTLDRLDDLQSWQTQIRSSVGWKVKTSPRGALAGAKKR